MGCSKNISLIRNIIFFLLNFTLLPAIGMEKDHEKENNLSHHNLKTIVTEHLDKNPDLINSSKNKDIVVFLGNTGAGKSTLINYLSNKDLEVGKYNKIVLKNPSDSSALAIGGTRDSVTLLPRLVSVGELLLYDLPGFGDTRGTAINLVNASFIKGIIENANSTKLVFVVGADQVTSDRGKSFQILLDAAQRLIPGEQLFNFSALIVTKSDQDEEDLFSYLEETIDTEEAIGNLIRKENITQMSTPRIKKINEDERQPILKIIRRIAPQKIKNVNIEVIYPHQISHILKNFYKDEINEIAEHLIKRKTYSEEIDVLQELKKYFENNFFNEIQLSVESSSFINFLKPISKKLYEQSLKEIPNDLKSLQKQKLTKISVLLSEMQTANLRKKREGDNTTKYINEKIEKLYESYRHHQKEIERQEIIYNNMDPTKRWKFNSDGGSMSIYNKAGWFPTLKKELKVKIDEIKNKQSNLQSSIGRLQDIKSQYILGEEENISRKKADGESPSSSCSLI